MVGDSGGVTVYQWEILRDDQWEIYWVDHLEGR